jgi:hypothetical protein
VGNDLRLGRADLYSSARFVQMEDSLGGNLRRREQKERGDGEARKRTAFSHLFTLLAGESGDRVRMGEAATSSISSTERIAFCSRAARTPAKNRRERSPPC